MAEKRIFGYEDGDDDNYTNYSSPGEECHHDTCNSNNDIDGNNNDNDE